MANSPNRFYWDACTWIAFIQKEKVELASGQVEDRESMCRSVLIAAKAGKVEIATSTLSLEHVPKKLLDFFDQDMLQLFDFERVLFDHLIPRDRDAL